MVKIAFFQTHKFECEVFKQLNAQFGYEITFLEPRLTFQTADLAKGHDVVCSFANDKVDAAALDHLKLNGVKLVACRSAGFNHVDIRHAVKIDLSVVRVPAYSPNAVAEHAVALLLCLNRKLHKAHNRIHTLNFSLDGLVGFDLHGKSVAVVGTGRIGTEFCKIMAGFGCRILAHDKSPSSEIAALPNCSYTAFDQALQKADVVSLHVPLTPETLHMIDQQAFERMKPGAYLINTSRGGLVDTKAMIQALKSEQLGGAALDVYEEEEGVFFYDLSEHILKDDALARLMTFPNVLITAHQAFLTKEALGQIAMTTLRNIRAFSDGGELVNQVTLNDLSPSA